MRTTYDSAAAERVETVIIGAGQAGLSVGYHLARRGKRFVILEAHDRIGDSWRTRWDSLRLFSPAKFDALDGMPFPSHPSYFPTKDEMASYLEAYAERFQLPVRTGMPVTSLTRHGDRYRITATGITFEADNVVIAMANYQKPRVPEFAPHLDPSIVQLHSADYRNLGQLKAGGVLIVGAGNSGAEIAVEAVSGGHETWISGPDVGALPFRYDGVMARAFLTRLIFRVVFHRVLTTSTPVGRKARPKMLHNAAPLIRTRRKELAAAGVPRVARVTGVRDGRPLLADGRVMDAANVVWCTGFYPGFSWLELPVFDEHGDPRHHRGIVPREPGLFFVGLQFLHAMSSTMIHGVGRDADYVASAIAKRPPGATTAWPLREQATVGA
ncbi:MAG TPA: FAD-dependent oxidoreductase [Gemmatimonadaceae bacterium]|nr:FAD-dependent oxidoreductase [Gemmatimonadaceae bacterium]